jgi:hypothetical protein
MSTPGLLSRIQALEANSGFPNGLTTSTVPSPTTGWTEVNPPVLLVNLAGLSTTWTTISLASCVPSTATRVLLNVWGRNDGSPDNDDTEVDIRKNSTSITRIAVKNRGVNSSYSGEGACTIEVPLSSTGTIDYQVTPGKFGAGQILLLEYM